MYIEVDEDFPSHPKSVRLCAALGNPIAWAYMIKLWSWARKYQKDGDLSAYEPVEIEGAIGWTGEPGRLFAAAVRAGFIDDSGGVRALHNWMDRSGGGIKRAEDEATRKRLWRLHRTGKCDAETCSACATDRSNAENGFNEEEPSASRPQDVLVNETGQSADGSHQDKTSQGKSRQDPDLSLPSRGSGSGPAGARSNGQAKIELKPGPVTGFDLQRIFGRIREREVPDAIGWHAPPSRDGRASEMAEAINADPGAAADVVPSMELFLRTAKDGKRGPQSALMVSKPAFGFAVWCSDWTPLREALRAAAAPRPPREILPVYVATPRPKFIPPEEKADATVAG